MDSPIPKNPFHFNLFASRYVKKWIFGAFLWVILATFISKSLVIIIQMMTDTMIDPTSSKISLMQWAIVFPFVYVISETVWRMSGFFGMRWFTGMRGQAYLDLYSRLTLQSKGYFKDRFAGALANKISNSVNGSEVLFHRILWNFLPLFLGICIYIMVTFQKSLYLGLVIFFWSVIFLTINIIWMRYLNRLGYIDALAQSDLKGKLVDSLGNISLIHEGAAINFEKKYISKYTLHQSSTGLTHWWWAEWGLVTNGILIAIFVVIMFGGSVYLFHLGKITLGVVIMVVAIVRELSDQLFFVGNEMSKSIKNYSEAKEGLDEILKDLTIKDDLNATKLEISKATIFFDKINFLYENNKVFDDFSLLIKSGQRLGIVGKSGAGKTTLVSLLLRHYPLSSGEIRIDEKDISKVTLNSLRKNIAYVAQDTTMFHRTIFENLTYFDPHISEEEVIAAAKAADAWDFIKEFPQKLQTYVGERGIKLSGGQRQRISIVRAFLKHAPILILDEATSALDSESEKAIQKSLLTLMKGKTVIAIAHRLSTLRQMDRIIVIESGRIIEDGSPEILLKNERGHFKKMWDHQVSGFIVDENI